MERHGQARAVRRAAVTMRAMLQRLNRRLAKEHKMVKRPRGRGDNPHLGRFFVVDTSSKLVVDTKVSPKRLEEMARQLGCLAAWEEVER